MIDYVGLVWMIGPYFFCATSRIACGSSNRVNARTRTDDDDDETMRNAVAKRNNSDCDIAAVCLPVLSAYKSLSFENPPP